MNDMSNLALARRMSLCMGRRPGRPLRCGSHVA